LPETPRHDYKFETSSPSPVFEEGLKVEVITNDNDLIISCLSKKYVQALFED
jgi:hypothetical protein